MFRRIVVLITALIVSFAPSVSGTGVVAFRTSAGIVLAADAAMTSFDQRGEVLSVSATGCKLGQAGPWTYVWGGLQATGTTTDLRPSFTRAIAPARTLPDLTTAVRRFLADDIETLDWDKLGATFGVDRVIFWAGIGRVVNGRPWLGVYRAAISRQHPIGFDVVAATCPGDCVAGWLSAGHAAARGPIAELLSSDPMPPWLARLDGPAAHRLLSAQADATPRFIKRPLDVLELSSSGARWIARASDSSCPANPNDLGESK